MSLRCTRKERNSIGQMLSSVSKLSKERNAGNIILHETVSLSFVFDSEFKVARGYLLERRHPFLNRILGK